MIKINNYISDITQSIITYISAQKFQTKFEILPQFNRLKSPIHKPVISLCFDKISITPLAINNYISDSFSDRFKIDIKLTFSVYVPIKMGAITCYDIFYEISDTLLKNKIDIPISLISCSNIELKKSINCFFLAICVPISMIPG